jgi:hypothetical protein
MVQTVRLTVTVERKHFATNQFAEHANSKGDAPSQG